MYLAFKILTTGKKPQDSWQVEIGNFAKDKSLD